VEIPNLNLEYSSSPNFSKDFPHYDWQLQFMDDKLYWIEDEFQAFSKVYDKIDLWTLNPDMKWLALGCHGVLQSL
jgi:hypothetical protein